MTDALDLRLGIDVGGTNTDAVVVDRDGRVLGKAKVPTTADASDGVAHSLAAIVGTVDPARISHVMLGTTQAANAVLHRRGLRTVAVIRIGSPATHAVRPLYGWPADLRAAVSLSETIVRGGIEFDGRDIVPFEPDEVRRFLEGLSDPPDSVAITGVFSPVSARHEIEAAAVAREVLGDIDISLSHEIGSIGLLERENATVLNATLGDVARKAADSLDRALAAHGLSPAIFFAQNDGTLMSLDHALRYPVLTIGSGAANSIRGAGHLMETDDVLVMDVGGTTTDVGALVNGFPRESVYGERIGGVRTNFRMPDLVSLSVGGGTVVIEDGTDLHVGPRSVGFRLGDESLVFGGATPTLTDAAVASGRTALGDRSLTAGHTSLLGRSLVVADQMFADAVDRIKVASGEQPLVVVGGGSILVPERLLGVGSIHRPEHYEVANAIGAAIASVSGQVEQIVEPAPGEREQAIGSLSTSACERAIQAGADPSLVQVVDIEEIPLAYLTTPAVRIRVRAAGPIGRI